MAVDVTKFFFKVKNTFFIEVVDVQYYEVTGVRTVIPGLKATLRLQLL